MKKLFLLAVFGLMSLASFALTAISGPGSVCVGSGIILSDSLSPGGTWASSNVAVATVGSSTGYVTGIAAGTVVITYTLGGSFVTATVAVSPAVSAITGSTTFCTGIASALTDATTGGVWSSYNPSVASVDPTTGVVTGVSAGSTDILYTVGGCSAYVLVTVTGTPVDDSISGGSSVCVSSTISLTDITTGGVWSSSNPSVATIGASTGVVTGVSAGTTVISYTVTGTCGTAMATPHPVTVSSTTSPGSISGATSVSAGATIALSDGTGGGTWSSSDPSVATIGASTGIVTGVAAGTVVLTYTVTGCSGPASVTYTVTVTAFSGISGNVLFTGSAFYGPVKVWLITYNPSTFMLEAVDSTTVSCSGTSVYYQFASAATDSFRIKAWANDSSTTGYIPTYHTSGYHWNTATVLYHTSGIGDINQNITMLTGTTTSGPGFIAGNVTTGADRGTSGTIPAVGLLMYAVNSVTGAEVQQTYTDASGNYQFSSLPIGTYTVHPEAINYLSTDYPVITIATGSATVSGNNFIQHLISHTITPIITEGVNNVKSSVSSVVTFPNPTNGKLTISWNEAATENATVTVTDITGRNIYSTTVNMNAGAGATQVDLSGLVNGLYMINIKSSAINYNNKVQIQK